MDKVVDHIFEYKGDGVIKDFPGNYTQLRDKQQDTERQLALNKSLKNLNSEPIADTPVKKEKKSGISFKEKKEFEALGSEIQKLESEKSIMESEMSHGSLSPDDLYSMSKKHGDLVKLLDDKEMRWLELSEK